MRKRLASNGRIGAVFAVLACIGLIAPHLAEGADHQDSNAATAAPTADIADVYAWMSDDNSQLNLIMTVGGLGGASAFDTDTQYVFHITTRDEPLGADDNSQDLVCQFYDAENIECWLIGSDDDVDDYVTGDPDAAETGITSTSGDLQVYAGLRDDPFYFNLEGFSAAVTATVGAAGDLTFDDGNCPNLDTATTNALATALTTDSDGSDATDDLEDANVLAIVVSVNTSAIDGGDLGFATVWGSTHQE